MTKNTPQNITIDANTGLVDRCISIGRRAIAACDKGLRKATLPVGTGIIVLASNSAMAVDPDASVVMTGVSAAFAAVAAFVILRLGFKLAAKMYAKVFGGG